MGRRRLWNPLNNCGVPFLAQWNTSVCYPLSLVFMVFPLPWSLNYFCLGHLLLAGVGMYLLAYRWTQNRLAASIAGLVFALNGLMLNSLMWTSNLAALSWQPLVMLWVEQAWRTGGRRARGDCRPGRGDADAGRARRKSLCSPGPCWECSGSARRGGRKFHFGRRCEDSSAMVVLIAGLSAIQLLPFFDLLKHSERNSSYIVADASPMPIWGWANFVVPFFHCMQTAFGTCLQPDQSWTSSYYWHRNVGAGGRGGLAAGGSLNLWTGRHDVGRDWCWRWATAVTFMPGSNTSCRGLVLPVTRSNLSRYRSSQFRCWRLMVSALFKTRRPNLETRTSAACCWPPSACC